MSAGSRWRLGTHRPCSWSTGTGETVEENFNSWGTQLYLCCIRDSVDRQMPRDVKKEPKDISKAEYILLKKTGPEVIVLHMPACLLIIIYVICNPFYFFLTTRSIWVTVIMFLSLPASHFNCGSVNQTSIKHTQCTLSYRGNPISLSPWLHENTPHHHHHHHAHSPEAIVLE